MRFDHRAVPIALSAVLIDSIGFGIVLPVLPKLIVHLSDVTMAEATRIAGYMLVAFAGAQFFAGPVLGNLGDHFGRRLVLLCSMLAFAIDYLFMAAAPTLAWLFVGRLIAGAAGAIYGAASAVLADVTPPEKRGATFGLMGAMFGTGFILGPAIGGLLAGLGPRAPFIAAACLAGLNATWIALALPETLAPEKRRPFRLSQSTIFGAFKPLFHAGVAAPLLLAAFLWQLGHTVYPATWAFWAKLALNWNEAAVGWSLAGAGTVMVLAQAFVTGPAIRRFGEERAVLIGAASATLVFFGYAFVTHSWMVVPLLIVGGLQGLVWPSMTALLSRMADASHQGALQGGMASLSSVAQILGPLMLTQALAFGAEHGHPGGAFLMASCLACGALLVVAFGVVPRVHRGVAVT